MERYIAVVKQLENKKYLIKFPDFEGVSGVAEKETSIERVASGILNTKLQELKFEQIEKPIPMELSEIQKNLQEGEFVAFITLKAEKNIVINKENLKETFDNLQNKSKELLKGDFKENVEKIYSKSEELVQEKIGKNIKSENYSIVGLVGGVLYFLSTFMPMINIRIPILGDMKIGFTNLSDIEEFGVYVNGVSSKMFMIRFVLILMMMAGLFVAYSAYKKQLFFLKSGIAMSAGLYGVSFIYVFFQMMSIDSQVRKYVGFSYFWLGMLFSLVLMGVAYILLNKEQVE